MAKSKTYEMLLKIAGKTDGTLKAACSAAEKDLNTLGSAAKAVGTAAATALAGIATAAAGVAASSLSAYSEFEAAMDSTAVTARATAEEYELMEAAARQMGATTTKTATEAAEAMGYMALAGWDVEQSMAGLEPMLRLSEATGMDLARASDLATDSMSALGLGVKDMTDYLDLAVQAQRASNTTAEALMEAFIGCGGIARTVGVDMGDLSTALGVLANNGTKGAEAGTALNSILSRITAKDVAIKAMENIGVAVYDTAGNFRGLETILTETAVAMENMSDKQKMASLKDIAGTDYGTEMAYLLAATSKNAETAEEYLRAAGLEGDELAEALANTSSAWSTLETDIMDHSGVLLEVAQANTDNLAGATAIFKSAVSELQLQIGEQLAPYAKEGLEYLANNVLPVVAEKAGEIIPMIIEGGRALWENRNTILAVGGAVVTAVGAFKGLKVASAGIGAVKNLSTILGAASKNGNLLTKVLSMGNVKLALIAGVIALVAAGFVLLWNKSEKFRETVIGLWEKLQPLGASLAELAGMIGSLLAPVFEIAGTALINALGHAIEVVAPIIENIIGALQGLVDFVTGVFTGNWEQAWQGVCEVFGAVFGGIVNLAKVPINAVTSAINSVIEAINSCGFSIPDWVPVVGGQSFSLNLPTIPQLATGGIVTAPTILEAGEGGEPEAVLPLSKLDAMLKATQQTPEQAMEITVLLPGLTEAIAAWNNVQTQVPVPPAAVNVTTPETPQVNLPEIPDAVNTGADNAGQRTELAAMLQGVSNMLEALDMGSWEDEPEEAPLAQLAKMLDDWTKNNKPGPQGPGLGGAGSTDYPDPPGGGGNDSPPPEGGQNPPGGGVDTITFAPVFNFYGPTTPEQAKEAGQISFAEFKRLVERYKAEERRKNLRAPTH